MDADKEKGNGKVRSRDWSAQEALRTYKRRRRPEPEFKPVVVPEQQVTDTFWKSRDIGWKHGIMIDENRQHWKCMYCHLTRYGGGVSRLKRSAAPPPLQTRFGGTKVSILALCRDGELPPEPSPSTPPPSPSPLLTPMMRKE